MKKTPFLSYILAALLACAGIPHAAASTASNVKLTDDAPSWDVKANNWYYTYTDSESGVMYACYDLFVDAKDGRIVNGGWSSNIYIHSGASLTADYLLQWTDNPEGSELWRILYSYDNDDYRLHIYMYDNSTLNYTYRATGHTIRLGALHFEEGARVNLNLAVPVIEARSFGKYTERSFTINAHINTTAALLLYNEHTSAVELKYDQNMDVSVERGNTYCAPYIDLSGRIILPAACYRTELNGCTIKMHDGLAGECISGYLSGTTLISLGDGEFWGRDIALADMTEISWLLNNIEVRQGRSLAMRRGYYGGTISMRGASSLVFDMKIVPAQVDTAHWEGGATVVMENGNNTLDLAGKEVKLDVVVNEATTGNMLKNGSLTGTLTLEAGSTLNADSAMCSWAGPESIVMNNGSTLNMVGSDKWINNLYALQVNGEATINGAYLRVRASQASGHVYTLGHGVENLKGENTYFVLTGDEGNYTFDLCGKTANFGIIAWESANPADLVVRTGTIDKSVEIRGASASRPYSRLKLESVTIGDNATFSMGNNTQLDLGGQAIPLERITVSSGATASVSNFGSAVSIASSSTHTLEYDAQGFPVVLKGNNSRLRLEDSDRLDILAGDDATILISEQSKDINLHVITDGMFTFGKSQGAIQKITGQMAITYNGPGTDTGNTDVNMLYQLIGSLDVTARNGSVNAGIIGQQKDDVRDTTSTGYVEAKQILVGGFIGKNLTLRAVSNAALKAGVNAITVKGNAIAAESLIFNAVENGCGNIAFNSNLSAKTIKLEGNNIEGDGDDCAVEFTECTIRAQGGINIEAGFTGGDLTMTAAKEIKLGQVGMNGPVGKADISSQSGAITMGTFTGGSLKAVAAEDRDLTINGGVSASGSAELRGRGVSVGGSLAASGGSANIESFGGGNITLGGALSAGNTITLESKARIIGADTDVLGGNLTARALRDITLRNIGTAEQAVGKTELTTQSESITAASFTGASLKASARGDLTINGGVTALSGNVELTGKSVSIGGALAANIASAWIKSTTGDISLGGALIAAVTITLDSANNINGQDSDVQGGGLMATAAQSITLGKIGIGSGSAVLTAANGSITAVSFTGGTLEASAKGAVTFNGGVTASSGNAELTGGSVSTGGALAANNASASIKSTTGDIKLGGALSAKDSITVQSAGNIAIGGDVTGGNLTATAAQSISLRAINIDSNAAVLTATNGGITAGNFIGSTLTATAGDSITLGNLGTYGRRVGTTALTATNGSITVGNFNGNTLEASAAKGAVTINGSATAFEGSARLTGGSVSISGILAAYNSSADITSTTGNITLGGEVRVKDSITLISAGSITGEAADMHGANLTVTAEQSIALKNIDIFSSPATLTAKSGSITAGKVTVVNLSANAAGNIALGDVEVDRTGAVIVSTGGNVELNTFSGSGAQISAQKGSIQVNSAVSGTGNTFLAGQSVAFAAAASESGLSIATVSAPQVSWANGTTLTNVTLTGGAGEDGAEADAEVGVGGSLVLKESRVKGDVTIGAKDAKLTVDHSAITGTELGARDIELNGGSIGSVYLEEGKKLGTFTSSGTSRIDELVCDLVVENGILNGGELTLTPALGEDFGLVPGHLTVNQSTKLSGNLYLQLNPGLNFSLQKANTETPLLTIDGTLECIDNDYIVINLQGDASVEGGETYALISVKGGESPEGWPKSLTVSGLGAKQDEFFWVGGTLFYQNGTELKTAVWSPGENHLWNTTDKNWTQDGHLYRYRDGVDVVFNDTGMGGDVQLEGARAPKDVLVEGSCDYTFTGTGKITGETALTKNGSGTLTIATANDYTGGTAINGGTLAMKNAQALGTGTITMAGGATLDLGGFAAGNSVTLQGSASIRNGSLTGTLALADGASLNWWGEDLNLSGGATLGKDAHLYLNGKSLNNAVLTASGATIHYGTVTGNLTLADSVSYSWDALRGNGLTLSGGVTLGNGTLLNLDGSTISNPITLKGTATLGNGTLNGAFSVAGGHTLTLCGNLDGTGDITLGERATLNLGNHTLGKGVVVHKSATLGNGTLNGTLTLAEGTAFSWSSDSLQLNGGVTLKEGAALILGSHTLAGNVTLEGSAFIGGGTINSGFSVAGGHTLTLCGNLEGMGFITLGDTATLDLASFELKNSVTLEGSATIGNGALHSPLSLEGGKALKLIGDLSGTGTIIMGNDSRLDLNGKTLDLAVDATFGSGNVIAGDGTINGDVTVGVYMDITGTLNGSGRIILKNSASLYAGTINNDVLVTRDKANTQANIFSGTLNGTLTLADNASLCLRGELAVTGAVTMGDNTELDLGGHMLDKGVALQGSATIGNGRINGELSVAAGKTLTLNGNLEGYGNVYLNGGTTLNLNNHELGKSVYLQGSATVGSGTINGTINVTAGNTLTLSGNLNGSTGNLHLNDSTTLDLNSHVLDMRHVILAGSTTIGGGTLNTGDTILSVNGGTTLTLSGDLAGSGSVHMFDNSTLNLGNHMLYKDVYLVGPATISAGSLAKIRTIGSGTLDLGGRLHVDELDVWSERTINMNGNTLEVQTLDMRNHTLTLNGKGELIIGEGTIGGAIVKTGTGRLDIQGSASLTGLDAQGGELSITGTADAKGGIASLKAAEGATVELVHTNATTANETQAYKGNLVIGNGSTVTAGCTDGWAYESSNSLTLQKGGKLDLANHRWIIAPGNKVTLAGGEIAGAGHDTLGALDFHGGASVVAVTEDSTLSARIRVRGTGSDALTFDVAEDKVLSVTGDIISCGADEDDKGTVYKTGAGTMVMSGSNAMVESGTINVQAGILKVTGNSNPLGRATVNVTGGATLELGGAGAPAGTVTLAGGTLKISEGSKDFALVATGTGNLLDFNGGCTFTGSLKMQDGSSLEMAMGEGKNSWIEDVSRLSVDGESATLANAYLRIKESYTLGNGVENLKGEGVTAFCLDGSTFNLARGTSNLDIIVWSGQSNQIRNGMIGTKVDIRSGSKLALLGATIGDGAAILMEDQACLDMNYGEARLSWFTFTGETATIDNGTLLVAAGESVQLGTRLQGSDTIISLGKGANLDLNGYSMDSSKIDLADDSSTVSGGTLFGDVTVKSGKTLRLGVDQSIAGGVKLEKSSSTLSLGSGCSVEGAISGSGTIMKEGAGTVAISGNALQNFTGSLEVQGGILNLMNAASQGVQDVTIGANSTLGVFIGGDPTPETASEGTLTMTHGHTLTAGKNAALNANLVLQSGSILDVSEAKGRAGLQMGSTVTLEPGNVLLSAADMDAVNGLSFMGKYDLFSGVDGLSLDNGANFLVELGLADSWVNAADVFGNDLFKDPEKEYYVFYSGASNKGGAGGNVGTVYVMLLPEPTTDTLSLLALCALAARRRRK